MDIITDVAEILLYYRQQLQIKIYGSNDENCCSNDDNKKISSSSLLLLTIDNIFRRNVARVCSNTDLNKYKFFFIDIDCCNKMHIERDFFYDFFDYLKKRLKFLLADHTLHRLYINLYKYNYDVSRYISCESEEKCNLTREKIILSTVKDCTETKKHRGIHIYGNSRLLNYILFFLSNILYEPFRIDYNCNFLNNQMIELNSKYSDFTFITFDTTLTVVHNTNNNSSNKKQ